MELDTDVLALAAMLSGQTVIGALQKANNFEEFKQLVPEMLNAVATDQIALDKKTATSTNRQTGKFLQEVLEDTSGK